MRQDRNHIDLLTFLSVLTLMVLSVGVVYSASSTWAMDRYGESAKLLGNHAIKVLLGMAAMFVFMQIDYHKYRKLTKPALVGAISLLIVTLALGGEKKGATRWLALGGLGIQPTELAKYALIFHLCFLTAEKKDLVKDFMKGFLPMLIWISAVAILVLAQPNVSNGAMIFALGLLILFIGRARVQHVVLSLGILLPPLLVYMFSAEYRMRRIMSYLSGGNEEAGHQLRQAIIGLGNGGIFGLGPGGSQQRDHFLPEAYGDFVFSIVGEEYGLIGTLFFVTLFMLLMLRGMRIARYSRDEAGRMLAIGITCSITLYALINAGVTLGILPTTGLPMPFVSYGGTAMIMSCVAVGVLLNISMQTDLYPRLTGAPEDVRPLEPVRSSVAGRIDD